MFKQLTNTIKSALAAGIMIILMVAFLMSGTGRLDAFQGNFSGAVITAGSRTVTPLEFKKAFDSEKGRYEQQYQAPISPEEAVKGGEKRVRLPNGKELNVKIPPGVTAGQQIRLKGQGDTSPGHPPGDLLITINIAPHPFFKVDGNDLRVDLPITLYEAVLGGKVRVPTLGNAVELTIPKNTSSGRTFRLKGKGLPHAGASGDLLVTTRIMLPDGNDADLETLMQRWRDTHPYNPRSDLG